MVAELSGGSGPLLQPVLTNPRDSAGQNAVTAVSLAVSDTRTDVNLPIACDAKV
jgi:hypothetical protein